MSPFPATLSAMQLVMDAGRIEAALAGFAAHIMDNPRVTAHGIHAVAIVGIRSRGELLAQRIARIIEQRYGTLPDVGALDITMYRDDLSSRRAITIPLGTEMNFQLDDRIVFVIDDVLHTGRTIRAALDALVDFGRPRAIHALALIDRGGREYPIAADHAGMKLEAPDERKVVVHLQPTDDEDGVYVD
jgi:pyrimidine operon attenuation protein / uracil phosphoribosyltransferase